MGLIFFNFTITTGDRYIAILQMQVLVIKLVPKVWLVLIKNEKDKDIVFMHLILIFSYN